MNVVLKAALAIVLALAAFATFLEAAVAADPVVTDLRMEAPSQLTVGDRFRYVITVDADRGTTLTLAPGAVPKELALAQAPKTAMRDKGDQVEITMTLEMAAFVTGDLTVPPFKLRYRGAGRSGEIQTPGSRLSVISVLTPSDLQLRPLKPQAKIGEAGVGWLIPAIVATLAALILVIALIIWRRRALGGYVEVPEEPEAVPGGPEDRARAILDKAATRFLADHDYVTYYTTIGATERNYLTERFGFPAFALTTREMRDQMVRRGMDRWQARITDGLLSQCDAVIYAGYRPAAERADADLTAAYEIVEMSRPVLLEPELEITTP